MKKYYSLLTIYNAYAELIAYSIASNCEYEYTIRDNDNCVICNWVFDTYEAYNNVATCCKNSINATELINL